MSDSDLIRVDIAAPILEPLIDEPRAGLLFFLQDADFTALHPKRLLNSRQVVPVRGTTMTG